MVITGSNDHSIVLNNFGEFTDRCISGVLSESNPGFRKLGVLLFLLFLPTGDGASTMGGLFIFLSLHASMTGVLTREFLHCFIWSPEDFFCVLGFSVWTMAAAFQMGLSGILKSNCISGRMSWVRLFLCLPLTVFERMLSDREMPNSTADGEFLSVQSCPQGFPISFPPALPSRCKKEMRQKKRWLTMNGWGLITYLCIE